MTPTNTRPYQATEARPAGKRRTPLVAAIAGGVIIAIATSVWALNGRGAGSRIDAIGVMPIEDHSGRDSVFAVTLHEAVTNSLVRLGTTGVAPRSTMMRYRDGTPTRDVARENNLDAVVEATVYRDQNVMIVNVQLTNPVTSRAIWSEVYERPATDLVALQRDVAQLIADGIRNALAAPRS